MKRGALTSYGQVLMGALVVALLALTACSGDKSSLTGRWTSDGYNCESSALLHEVFDVVQTGDAVTGTKVVGDNCVRSGQRSFQGTVKGKSGSLDYWLGSPGATPTLALRNQKMTVVSKTEFAVDYQGRTVTYTRAAAAHKNSLWIWLVLLAMVALLGFRIWLAYRRRGPASSDEPPPSGRHRT